MAAKFQSSPASGRTTRPGPCKPSRNLQRPNERAPLKLEDLRPDGVARKRAQLEEQLRANEAEVARFKGVQEQRLADSSRSTGRCGQWTGPRIEAIGPGAGAGGW